MRARSASKRGHAVARCADPPSIYGCYRGLATRKPRPDREARAPRGSLWRIGPPAPRRMVGTIDKPGPDCTHRARRNAWVRASPDHQLGGDVDVARPSDRAVTNTNAPEIGIVRGESLVDLAPRDEVGDVALDDRAVGQRQPESSSLERRGSTDSKHGVAMLAERRDLRGLPCLR